MSENNQTVEAVERALRAVGSDMEAVEVHGHLAGILCAQGTVEREEWLQRIVPERAEGDVLAGEALEILGGLFDRTARQMGDPVLDFHLLLPQDEDSLEERVQALGDWCQGFLLGLSEGGVDKVEGLPEDSAEIVRDMVDISRAGNYLLEEGEEDEGAYAELLEYVRTGVLLINEELNPSRAPPRPPVTYH